jgi:hypothetical protein
MERSFKTIPPISSITEFVFSIVCRLLTAASPGCRAGLETVGCWVESEPGGGNRGRGLSFICALLFFYGPPWDLLGLGPYNARKSVSQGALFEFPPCS